MKPAVYTPDPQLSEPTDVLLEHALLALSVEEQFIVASRVAAKIGYGITARPKTLGRWAQK